jgi:hypothetical protein
LKYEINGTESLLFPHVLLLFVLLQDSSGKTIRRLYAPL